MKYFDVADVKVSLDAPTINVGPRALYFDIGAQNWPVIHKSPLFDSFLVEEVHDDFFGFCITCALPHTKHCGRRPLCPI